MKDAHGQPYNIHFNRARRAERDLSEMLGLIKGVLADGVVSDGEAKLLDTWVANHADAVEQWPVNILSQRLADIFADGVVDEDERADLAELLGSIVGGDAGILSQEDSATELPFDTPAPAIEWPDSVFVFTGKFAFGPRADCERAVEKLDGQCKRSITKQCSYLVIGTFGSHDWIHTSFGRKIQKAVDYREAGVPIRIISEEHWVTTLQDG